MREQNPYSLLAGVVPSIPEGQLAIWVNRKRAGDESVDLDVKVG